MTTTNKKSWILVEIVDGEIDRWTGGGEWHTPDKETYIAEGDGIPDGLEMEPEIEAMMKAGETFGIRLTDVSFVTETGYWDLNFGYVPPDAHIEWEGYELLRSHAEAVTA